jgi:hypothetical protein
MAMEAELLDALLAPSTDGASEVWWLKSSLLHRVEASILPPTNPKDGGQRATQGASDAGMTSSLVGFSMCDHPGQPSSQSEPETYRWHHLGDDGAWS